jgi:nitrite reductase (NADH) large subunit
MVAQRLLEQLCERQDHSFRRIVVIGGEPAAAYNRILLSSVLAGEAQPGSIALKPDSWFEDHGIVRRQGEPVVSIDRDNRQVVTANGVTETYDRLVMATGSRSASLGLEGEALPGVMGFRDLSDTDRLIETSQQHRHAVVIGGGFLGLEAAEGLRSRGMAVTVLHRADHLLNRQLDPVGGRLLEQKLSRRGLTIRTRTSPRALLGKDRVNAVELEDGTRIKTDLVVIAAGITPNIEPGRDAGLDCGRAIRVNNLLQTSDPAIYALGECCQMGDQTFGLVEPGYQQADVLARVLTNADFADSYQPAAVPTRLKISGIPIFSCGQTQTDDSTEALVWQDHDSDRYCRFLIRDGRLAGAVLFGETHDGPWYARRIQQADDISAYRSSLVFGREYCEALA